MDRKLKVWECALICGVLCAMALGVWLDREQEELAGQVIRLHVIANSDSPEDQALKLEVRDRVLERAAALCPPDATLEEMRLALSLGLEDLAAAGRAAVEEGGYSYPVTTGLARCSFPTKDYGGFALPAGEYEALRVVIGAGEGRNWWCVAFPPLCLGAASETVEQAVEAGRFSPEQAALLTGEGYVLKFKGMELLGRLRN